MTLLVAALLVPPGVVRAQEPIRAGARLPELEIADQNGVAVKIDASVRCVLLTRDMGAGKLVKEALESSGSELLHSAGAVYVSDISGMPAFVTSMFALPALRKRSYPVLLDRDGKQTAAIPTQEGRVTVLHLDAGVVSGVGSASSADEVRAALSPSAPSDSR